MWRHAGNRIITFVYKVSLQKYHFCEQKLPTKCIVLHKEIPKISRGETPLTLIQWLIPLEALVPRFIPRQKFVDPPLKCRITLFCDAVFMHEYRPSWRAESVPVEKVRWLSSTLCRRCRRDTCGFIDCCSSWITLTGTINSNSSSSHVQRKRQYLPGQAFSCLRPPLMQDLFSHRYAFVNIN